MDSRVGALSPFEAQLSTSLCRLRRYTEAITAALMAVHLNEGNTSEAVRQLDGELGLTPSEQLIALVRGGYVNAIHRSHAATRHQRQSTSPRR